jgi:hypothetical protein
MKRTNRLKTMSNQKHATAPPPVPTIPKELDYITVKGFRSIKSIEKLVLPCPGLRGENRLTRRLTHVPPSVGVRNAE